MSTKNDEFGLTPCVSSLRGSPPAIGACHSDTRSLSLPPTMIDLPSGIQRARAMLRSMPLAGPVLPPRPACAPAPPPAGGVAGAGFAPIVNTEPLFVAIILPSGENCGCVPLPPSGVVDKSLIWSTCRPPGMGGTGAAPGAGTGVGVGACPEPVEEPRPPTLRVKTMPVPSGVQTIADAGVP